MNPSPHLDEDALSLLEHVYSTASEILQRDGQVLSIAFFRVGPNAQIPPAILDAYPDVEPPEPGTVAMLPLLTGDDEEKDLSAAAMWTAFEMLDADLVVQVSESWVVKATNPDVDLSIPPRLHPDRTEALVLIAHKRGGRAWTVIAPIQRDANGKPSIPAQMPAPQFADSMRGRFAPD
ncbi:MAG: hypothetical protein NZT92_10580 [Abditibacteriales bacterium]|nr:hypothetical protein [Abditibacteriales bacterium]MDW8365855.1 hypothetical protein [Abditibacteriales bacterium]